MRSPQPDDLVVLLRDIPELQLASGDLGLVLGQRFDPRPAYEVEFLSADPEGLKRAMLAPEHIEIAPPSPFDPEPGSGRNLYF